MINILLALLFLAIQVKAQQLIERNFTLTSEKESVIEAKKEIQEKAFQEAVLELCKELIGEERVQKNKNLIQSKIIAKAVRFIPFSKGSELDLKEKTYSQTVNLKINVNELKTLLKENKLLEEFNQRLTIIPYVSFENQLTNKRYKWWSKQDEGYKKLALLFEEQFQKNLLKNGIFFHRPATFDYLSSTPQSFIRESVLNVDDLIPLCKWHKANFLLTGSVIIKGNEKKSNQGFVVLKLNLSQPSTQTKVLVDIQRQYDFPVSKEALRLESAVENKFKEEVESLTLELYQQLDEILQRGILNTQTMKLQIVMGAQPLKMEWMKEKIRNSIANVKALKEREITAQGVTYEMEFAGSPEEIKNKLLVLDVSPGKLSFLKSSDKEMSFELK
ncbi:MAG: hypothetical protein L6Q37_11210 [Bdellovibrionaceae bacterium]|nr:hypothetical protein [Pseudobdellovibrionaceae bacterium]NUM57710.1 hypothetical protein [Pseudobdellovibrionaceae bacterium]